MVTERASEIVNIANNKGPNTEPCGTSAEMDAQLEKPPGF